ncbi:unnamed protein product [Cladocopium goreaui]|uniref:Uncharacterized protein K02A2.1 n=1 Tax=Cladocopium goreaui TaxID=2562237 RepID=A0A9P1DAV1_9DINO|nr:unnamed protein product [Cladocopium goreaui]
MGLRTLLLAVAGINLSTFCFQRAFLHGRSLRPLKFRWSQTKKLVMKRTRESDNDESGPPRMAKDAACAERVQSAWRADPRLQGIGPFASEALVYQDEEGSRRLHGRLVRPAAPNGAGVVVVHTAVGPRDLYLHWRAEVLAAGGYTVLIADLLGDEYGQGWEPEWNSKAREPLNDRALSRKRMQASVAALAAVEGVDPKRIAAIGYCFGGRTVLDLARAGSFAGISAAVSFHGILDDGVIASEDMSHPDAPQVLICHGDADPFISAENRAACEEQLRRCKARWDMLVLGGVRHGFTNPAQALNPNPAFGYSARAASVSWKAAEDLLAESLR